MMMKKKKKKKKKLRKKEIIAFPQPTQDHQSLLNPFPSNNNNNNNKNKSFDETKACYNSSIFNQKTTSP